MVYTIGFGMRNSPDVVTVIERNTAKEALELAVLLGVVALAAENDAIAMLAAREARPPHRKACASPRVRLRRRVPPSIAVHFALPK